MKKTIYLIRHSGPFVELNYNDKITFAEKSKNMILSIEAEEKAKLLGELEEFKDIDAIYSSNSARAIATSKYISNINNISINIENNFNEREFGIKYIEDLPSNFIVNQFKDNDYKLPNGESLNEVDKRIEIGINKIFKNNNHKNIVIVLHGIALMVFIKRYCDVSYDEKTFKITHKGSIIYDDMIKAPDIFKLEIENDELINLKNINLKS